MTPKRNTHRLCIPGYAEILRGLHDAPATVDELAVRHDVTAAVMRGLTRRLHAQRVIRVAEWRQPKQGPAMRVFGFGGEADVPRPLLLSGRVSEHIGATARPPKPTIEITTFATLIHALTEKRGLRELMEITGCGAHSLSRNLKHMHSIGLLNIAGWERRRAGQPLPLYRIGIDKRDADRPVRESKRVSDARYNKARREKRAQMALTRAICSNASIFTMAA